MLRFPKDFEIPSICGQCGADLKTGIHTDQHGKMTLVGWPCQCTAIERLQELEGDNVDLKEGYLALISLIDTVLLPTIRMLGPNTPQLETAENMVKELIQDEQNDS